VGSHGDNDKVLTSFVCGAEAEIKMSKVQFTAAVNAVSLFVKCQVEDLG